MTKPEDIPFVAPDPIIEGTIEAEHERHKCRFLNIPYDLREANFLSSWAAFKNHHHRLLLERDTADK